MPKLRIGSSGQLEFAALTLAVGALLCCLLAPPMVAFAPARLPAILLWGAGAALLALALLLPRRWPRHARLVSFTLFPAGALILWLLIGWCVFSQISPITEPRSFTWGLRGLPLALVMGLWLWLLAPRPWQRRALLALLIPTLLGLALIAWSRPPHPLDFQPYYVAVDSSGVFYVSDSYAPVIRIFGPDGALRYKLRPGLASVQGPPGPGFMPPGPYNDPDGLGVPQSSPGARTITGA